MKRDRWCEGVGGPVGQVKHNKWPDTVTICLFEPSNFFCMNSSEYTSIRAFISSSVQVRPLSAAAIFYVVPLKTEHDTMC